MFGKFHGRTLGEIAALEPTYLAWVERTITRDPDLVAAARVVLHRPVRQFSSGDEPADPQDPVTGAAGTAPGAPGTAAGASSAAGAAAGNGNGDADQRPREEATMGSAG